MLCLNSYNISALAIFLRLLYFCAFNLLWHAIFLPLYLRLLPWQRSVISLLIPFFWWFWIMCQCQKMVIVLRLILQNTSGQSNHWNWYCKKPSSDICVDIAIAKHASDCIVLKLILQSTSFRYCNWCCYCHTGSEVPQEFWCEHVMPWV